MTRALRDPKPLFAALLGAAALVLAVPAAHAAPAALQQPTSHCWLDVINDWLDNNQVDGTYAIPCYTQAIQHLSALPDVAGYSSAIDDIHRAQLAAVHQERNNGGPGGGSSSSGGGTGSSSGGGGGGGSSSGGGLLGVGGPSDAQSIPLPLLVLGGLAILLALAALATWLARRVQSRRATPAPAVAKRR